MLSIENAIVKSIIHEDECIQLIEVVIDKKTETAINYFKQTGRCNINDRILVNTIGVRLGLGTGGYHIVYYVIDSKEKALICYDKKFGHIIKMKYTQIQTRVKAIEEEERYREFFISPLNIGAKPVIFASLHSMLPAVVSVIKDKNPNVNITCIYTYGGAMNCQNSFILRELKYKRLIDNVITVGECFGGDYEAINIYTALIFSFKGLSSDLAIVCCGPGIAGTSTYYGFSSLDLIHPIYASKVLGCNMIVVPRISLKDMRKRHYGISMHTIAILNCIDFPVYIPIPNSIYDLVENQLFENGINNKHKVVLVNGYNAGEAMKKAGIKPDVMGRGYMDDMEYFECCGASGAFIEDLI